MVLSRLRTLSANSENEDMPPVLRPGEPATFKEHLEVCRRVWNGKIAYQEKVRREWRRYSHDDVYRRSYELAAGFSAVGVQPGDRVAIILENGYDWVCSYYGIVLTGAVAVPIYYDLRPSEISIMIAHAEPVMAVVGDRILPKVEDALSALNTVVVVGDQARAHRGAPNGLTKTPRPELLSLDELAARATPESRQRVASLVVKPEDLASIVFTSGTSGGQKGVMLTHGNFMANLSQARRGFRLDDRDRLVVVLPLHHAFPFIVALAVTPAVGAEVTFENDLRRIRDRMAEVKPTVFMGVPALFEVMWRNILHSIEVQGRMATFEKGMRIVEKTKRRTGINIGRIVFRELHQRLGGHLRFMVSGGAALNPQVARDFATLGVCIIQGWGLSEAAPALSAQRWYPRKFYLSNHYEERFGSVGTALDGVEIKMIDVPEKELYVHLHGEGELIARGENITPGYWRSPDATAELKLGEWLRTGDIGRIDDEGNIWLTGRSKFVIVLDSGEKVYPDEVEEKLELSPVVQDIVVTGRKLRGKAQVVAIIYPNRDEVLKRLEGSPSEEQVRAIVEAGVRAEESDVAPYKRIVEFMLTDEPLPRTPLRKVMRGQIREGYTLDLARWERSWRDFLAAAAEMPAEDETAEPASA